MTKPIPIKGRIPETEAVNLGDNTRRREWEVFRYALSLMPKYWRIYLILFCLGLIQLFLDAIFPWIGRAAADTMLPKRDWSLLLPLLGLTITIFFFRWMCVLTKSVVSTAYSARITTNIRRQYFRHLRRLSWLFLQRRPIGEHIYRSISDCDGTSGIIQETIPGFVNLTVSFALILSFTIYLDPVVGYAVIAFAVPYISILFTYTTIRRRINKQEAMQSQKQVAGLQEGIAGVKTIKLFGRSRHEVRKYLGLVSGTMLYGYKRGLVEVSQDALINTFMLYGFRTGLYVYFAFRVIHGELSFGTLIVLTDYLERLISPMRDGVELFNATRMKLVPVERYMQTMMVDPMTEDIRLADAPRFEGTIAFKDVLFEYPDGRRALNGISFEAGVGKTVALVGLSGAGKSTVAGLILRLYDPSSGRILIDGQDIATFDPSSLQRQVGVVMQETDLFEGSIADNFRVMVPDIDDGEILKALEGVELGTWAIGLPQGIHTDLREGATLSIGQRQRLGIARALLSSPRMLVLDEPTSSLDARTEVAILNLLRRTADGVTKLVITHRLGTIQDADEILVLDHGSIVERGNHESLMAVRGAYHAMVQHHGAETILGVS
jgi:ABC-type multidrug transport system fused ATPase/permease subunit